MISLIAITTLLHFNSLLIFGVYASLSEGMIFESLGDKIRSMKSIFKKPLGTCPICMASVYGFPIFWGSYLLGIINYDFIIIYYICYTFALSGLNYIILAYMPE